MGKFIDFDKLKKAGEELVGKIKESGVVDKMKEGMREGVDVVSTKFRMAMPAEVKEPLAKFDEVVSEIVKKKQAGDDAIDELVRQAEQHAQAALTACRAVKKVEAPVSVAKPVEPAKPAVPEVKPAEPTKPEAPKSEKPKSEE